MALIHTPEDRFENIPDYEFEPRFVSVGDPEMAYIDVGSGEETFLCLHGEPTWGFLYRKMIPILANIGRVIVPDFVGFGRSDKYTDIEAYSFDRYYDWLSRFIEELDLSGTTLVCQDWGGILGLTLAAHRPERFDRLVPMNTDVPSGDQEMPEEWYDFHDFVERVDELPIRLLIQNATATNLGEATLAAYEAPFIEEAHKAAARAWPKMVPRASGGQGGEKTASARKKLAEWDDPVFVLFGDADPITHGARDPLRDIIPTARDQPDIWAEGAMHFLQEDAGEWLADEIVDFVERTR